MHTAKIEIKKTIKSKKEDQLELIQTLLHSWRMNGQILGNTFPITEKVESYFVFLLLPEEDSLLSKYNNKHVQLGVNKLKEESVFPAITILGKEPLSAEVCLCRSASSYILYTDYLSLESPLRCGSCFGCVPLYRLPKTYDEEYYDIICWMSDYQSCDHLQINAAIGEEFCYSQLSQLDSSLTKQGLAVSRNIKKRSGKKVYYYLYREVGRNINAGLLRRCPSCNGDWYQETSFHKIFELMCNKCGLLSKIIN